MGCWSGKIIYYGHTHKVTPIIQRASAVGMTYMSNQPIYRYHTTPPFFAYACYGTNKSMDMQCTARYILIWRMFDNIRCVVRGSKVIHKKKRIFSPFLWLLSAPLTSNYLAIMRPFMPRYVNVRYGRFLLPIGGFIQRENLLEAPCADISVQHVLRHQKALKRDLGRMKMDQGGLYQIEFKFWCIGLAADQMKPVSYTDREVCYLWRYKVHITTLINLIDERREPLLCWIDLHSYTYMSYIRSYTYRHMSCVSAASYKTP